MAIYSAQKRKFRKGVRNMFSIVSGFGNKKVATTVKEENIEKASESAIEAIKKELPKEAHTTEVLEYVISEISQKIKERPVVL